MKEWTAALAPFAGRQIVTYHPTWRYFGRRFGAGGRHLPRAEAGHPALAAAPREGDAEDAGREHPRAAGRAVPAAQDRRGRGGAHRRRSWSTSASFPAALPGTGTYLELIDTVVKRIVAGARGDSRRRPIVDLFTLWLWPLVALVVLPATAGLLRPARRRPRHHLRRPRAGADRRARASPPRSCSAPIPSTARCPTLLAIALHPRRSGALLADPLPPPAGAAGGDHRHHLHRRRRRRDAGA